MSDFIRSVGDFILTVLIIWIVLVLLWQAGLPI
jgi:hypothetical protein